MFNHSETRRLSDILRDPPVVPLNVCPFYAYNSWFFMEHQSGHLSCNLHSLEELNNPNTVTTAIGSNRSSFATIPTSTQLQDLIRDDVLSYSDAISRGTGKKVVATLVEEPRPVVVATLVTTNRTDEAESAHQKTALDDATQSAIQDAEALLQKEHDKESSLERALPNKKSQKHSGLELLTSVTRQLLTEDKMCQLCGTRDTGKWRVRGMYCNACGLKHMRSPNYERQKRSRDAKLCDMCGTDNTPRWRCSGTLCNACGLRKTKKKTGAA